MQFAFKWSSIKLIELECFSNRFLSCIPCLYFEFAFKVTGCLTYLYIIRQEK